MTTGTSQVRSKLTLVVAILALIMSTLAFLQAGETKARAVLTFEQRVENALNALRLAVATSAKQCIQTVNQTSADACSVVPDSALTGSDVQKNTLGSREVGTIDLSELNLAYPSAYAEYSASHASAGVRNYFLGSGSGFDDPGGATAADNWDQLDGNNGQWDNCTVQTATATVLPCLKVLDWATYRFEVTTTYKGSSQGSRYLSLIVWKNDGTGARDVYTAGGDTNFLTGIPASELPTSEAGSQRLTLTENIRLARGEKFSVFVGATSPDEMTSLTSFAVTYAAPYGP